MSPSGELRRSRHLREMGYEPPYHGYVLSVLPDMGMFFVHILASDVLARWTATAFF